MHPPLNQVLIYSNRLTRKAGQILPGGKEIPMTWEQYQQWKAEVGKKSRQMKAE